MREIAAYLEAIKLKLVTSRVVADYQIVKERTIATDGYLRIRATLYNGDFLEAAEYFERVPEGVRTVDYRYHVISGQALSICQVLDLIADAIFGEQG